jgi:hypothetical protein
MPRLLPRATRPEIASPDQRDYRVTLAVSWTGAIVTYVNGRRVVDALDPDTHSVLAQALSLVAPPAS